MTPLPAIKAFITFPRFSRRCSSASIPSSPERPLAQISILFGWEQIVGGGRVLRLAYFIEEPVQFLRLQSIVFLH
jgi:hypothetical protein